MTTNRLFGISIAALLAACSGAAPQAEPSATPGVAARDLPAAAAADAAADGHAHHSPDGLPAAAPLSGNSVYHLDVQWLDRHGAERQLGDLRGVPQAIAMVYTNCGSACPLIVADMKRLEFAFPELGLVLVSIDPARDTPGQLQDFFTGTRLNDRWTLLSGDDDSIAGLAAVLGVRYRRVSENDFMHSNVITVVDAGGDIVYRQEGLGDSENTIRALQDLFPAAR